MRDHSTTPKTTTRPRQKQRTRPGYAKGTWHWFCQTTLKGEIPGAMTQCPSWNHPEAAGVDNLVLLTLFLSPVECLLRLRE